jgi:hypothetical protein
VNSSRPRTAVCVLRIEERGAEGILVTLTTTLDIVTALRGTTRIVASYEQALALIAAFLREYASSEVSGNETQEVSDASHPPPTW